MSSEKQMINNYLDYIKQEQDELTLQKNYLSEATKILSSDNLQASYQAFITCLNDYPSYLFKKEKEFMFFMAKINELLHVASEEGLNFHDPSMLLEFAEVELKMYIYYTVQGVYELNFEHKGIDMALRLEVDMLNKKVHVLTQDLLNLQVSGQAKSVVVHYLTDVMDIFATIDFVIERDTTTNVDPFLMFDELIFTHQPQFSDKDYDTLFIAMDGLGEMTSMNEHHGVHLVLDEQNEASVVNIDSTDITEVTLLHKDGQIYLFDLLAAYPFLEQLFTGKVEFQEASLL